jgi:hypothetical protein
MPRQKVAAPTQRPVKLSAGEGRVQADGLFRILSATALLALLLPLATVATLGAPAPAVMTPPSAAAVPRAPAPDTPKVTLSAGELPATGEQKTLLTVDRFGRYSLRVENAQGSSVELVDRMAGSLGKAGEAGRESGRLDLFLDRGQYQVRVESAEKGTGKVKVTARSFLERRAGAPVPRLVETRLVQESLDDLEQISYWLEVGDRRGVRLEAAGRNLADLRLWRDGSWLEGVAPRCKSIQPVVGQPLLRCRLAAVLEPGLYLLTAYGGIAQPWAAGADDHPFYLRWGEPKLPESGRRRYVISPFGEDHFRLPDNVNFFRLELPEARPVSLATGWLRGGSHFEQETSTSAGAVTKESLPPATQVRAQGKPGEGVTEPALPAEEAASTPAAEEPSASQEEAPAEAPAQAEETTDSSQGSGDQGAATEQPAPSEGEAEGEPQGEASSEPVPETSEAPAEAAPVSGPPAWELVATVAGTPGQPYILQHFEQRDAYTFRLSGQYWVSSVHAGAAEDSVDATALVTDQPPIGKQRFLTAAAIRLDSHTPWARRFNFQEELTLFLEIKETGAYQVMASAGGARARIEPFLLYRPKGYAPPDWQGAISNWNLDAGYYVLTLQPQKNGILILTLRPGGKAAQDLPVPPQPVQAAVRFAPLTLEPSHGYTAWFNHQPGVTAGLVIRPWPVDLGQPLPVAQKPGEPFEIPFHISEAGTLRAEPDDGTRLDVAVDGGGWSPQAEVAAGDHKVAVRHDRLNTVTYSLWVEPTTLQATTPLQPLPDASLNAVPKLPVLGTGAPRFFELERGQQSTWLVQAEKPGLYAVRSTGLLATAGTLRTRTVPALRRDAQNGVGRNFLVQQYLREGDYQVTVAALGKSAGHAGLTLAATQLSDGGELRAGMPGHFTLPAGQAVVFHVAVTEAGRYTLRALGLGFKLLCRFEDADGWPLEKPNIPADLDEWLDPGTYRFVLLPQPVDARALVLLEKKPEPLEFSGHGPHALPLETQVGHVWVEPEGPEGLIEGAPRPPDLWQFEVPAKVHAAVELTDEMQGKITRLDATAGGGADIGSVPPGRAWKGELEPGRYQLATECSRRNSRVHYQVTVHTDEVVTGLERKMTAPGEVQVAVGRESLVELTSIAPADVRARLIDADGHTVAENDDRPDDWNFLLFQRLAPGRYTLKVEPVGVKTTEVRIAMRSPAEVEKAATPLPIRENLQLGSDVLLRPLPVGAKADLLLVAARSKDSLGLSVETLDGKVWRTVGTSIAREAHLEIPLSGKGEYRLRLWSLDRHETPVRLLAAAIVAPRLSEKELRGGGHLPAVAGFDPPLAAGVVVLDRPGVFRFADVGEGARDLRGSGAPGSPLTALGVAGGAVLSSPGERFWLVRDGKGARPVKAERVTVGIGLDAGTQFPVPAGTAVTADLAEGKGAGGPVLALATSPSGQPGVRVGESGEDTKGIEPAATVMAVGPRTAVSVALAPRHPVARVWQAGEAEGIEELRLSTVRFPPVTAEKASWGVLDGHLDGIAARRLDLPAGSRKLRLALGESTVAVLSRGDIVVSTHWQGGAPFEELLDEGASDRLTILHTGPGSDPYTVELLPRDNTEEAQSLSSGPPFERSLDRSGTLRIVLPEVTRPTATTLHVRGAGAEVTLLGRDGSVTRGADVPAGRGGVALVRHGPGLLLAWLGGPDDETASLWPAAERGGQAKVAPPASVPLSGRFADLTFAGSKPRILHLRTAVPLATLLHRPDGSPDEVEVHAEAGRLDAFLPAGETRLGLRSLAGAQLSGVAEITETPVTTIGEGLGPEVLLPAGGSRWFSFHVERKGPIGVGAHASSDVVEIELFDRGGHRLETKAEGGVVRMPELAPGDYLLALSSPAAAAPVKARPALAGLKLPDTGPPADVIRQYLQEAGAEEAPESVSGSQP